MNLKGAKVLLTGGSSGLGKAMAELLIEKGAKVLMTGRDEEKLLEVATELGAIPFQADVSMQEDVDATYEYCEEKLGGLDVMINNAGIGTRRDTIDELDVDDMIELYNVNVFGAVRMAKEAAKIFRKQKSGNIVNIASTAALKGYEGGSIYSSSKFALRGLSMSWQAELRRDNIRVFNINPSYVPTAFNQPERKERDLEDNKLTPHEIAHAVVAALEMDDRGYIPELSVHATNPF
ncbi:MAG: short-chain dehydrogenase [Flavobacteriales bacterium]|nr:short-chain dehydrogenase [Flavobacteriales bacterium]